VISATLSIDIQYPVEEHTLCERKTNDRNVPEVAGGDMKLNVSFAGIAWPGRNKSLNSKIIRSHRR